MANETLTIFEDGDTIYADKVNENFQYCLSDTSARISTLQTSVQSSISSINSNISGLQTTVSGQESSISSLQSSVSALQTSVSKAGKPNYGAGIGINSGYVTPSNGWINWSGGTVGDGSDVSLWVNGVKIGGHAYYKYGDSYLVIFPVPAGTTVTFNTGSGIGVSFYPDLT